MAEVVKQEAADPVGASFLAIADILEALTKVQPAVAGPQVTEALATIRAQWTPAAEPQPAE